MSKVTFVARCDDLGSSQSANRAIRAVTSAGLFKNVSVMAPGPFVEQAADMLKDQKNICFGMHTTLNAEWDRVKWGPVSELKPDCGLLDEQGYFLSDPSLFAGTKPDVEIIISEVSAQLDKLQRLGFDIRYIDSHMFPEMFIDGLDEAMCDFIRGKGLIDHMYYYQLPPGFKELADGSKSPLAFLRTIPAGQYFFISHPSYDTPEMRLTGNAATSGEEVARARDGETRMYSKKATTLLLRCMGISGVRYDEAAFSERLSVEQVKILLAQ